MMTNRSLAAASSFVLLLACVLPPRSASAASLTLTGDTTGAPVFNRPTTTGAPSIAGGNVPFNAFQFSVTQSGAYSFTLVADDSSNYDTFLHLYINGFNPAAPSDFFLAGNDDATNDPAAGSALNTHSLLQSGTY